MLPVGEGAGLEFTHWSFNGHPPLGVNATFSLFSLLLCVDAFQWAPTLGGECYLEAPSVDDALLEVSMGTHPWG